MYRYCCPCECVFLCAFFVVVLCMRAYNRQQSPTLERKIENAEYNSVCDVFLSISFSFSPSEFDSFVWEVSTAEHWCRLTIIKPVVGINTHTMRLHVYIHTYMYVRHIHNIAHQQHIAHCHDGDGIYYVSVDVNSCLEFLFSLPRSLQSFTEKEKRKRSSRGVITQDSQDSQSDQSNNLVVEVLFIDTHVLFLIVRPLNWNSL